MYKVRLILAAFLALQMKLSSGQTCTQEGFFRNPDDCSKFYRCVDLWQNGRGLTIYNFDCPVGTVFDEAVSVCNWPQLAAPCSNDNTNPGVGESTTNPSESTEAIGEMSTTEVNPAGPGSEDGSVGSGSGGDNGESVILTPSFSFQCDGEGIFEHANDCSKFWICELDGGNNAESQLYICPDNYLVSKNSIIKY